MAPEGCHFSLSEWKVRKSTGTPPKKKARSATCVELAMNHLFLTRSAFLSDSMTWDHSVKSKWNEVTPPSEDIITAPFTYQEGALQVPDEPGLGVEIDPKKFEKAKHRYEMELFKWQHVRGQDPRVPARQFYYWHNYPEKNEWQATDWPYKSGVN